MPESTRQLAFFRNQVRHPQINSALFSLSRWDAGQRASRACASVVDLAGRASPESNKPRPPQMSNREHQAAAERREQNRKSDRTHSYTVVAASLVVGTVLMPRNKNKKKSAKGRSQQRSAPTSSQAAAVSEDEPGVVVARTDGNHAGCWCR